MFEVTLDQFRIVLRKQIGSDTQRKYAREWGISDAYLSDVLAGRREPGEKILTALGYERNVSYRKLNGKAALT